MTPDRWARVERLYHEALERGAAERAAFLTDACAGDDVLRSEVESLLAHDGEAAFLSTPAVAGGGATLVGQALGPYVISARIGEGGMGEVYRARDQTLGRDVAIKVLPRVFTSDPQRLARFEREARMLAALNHPHIGAIYGVEERNGARALVLELVEGPTLAERLVRGPLPVAEALAIATQIAEALETAHEHGIVHRDLKPDNIKVTPNGVVKVLDFGLAKAVAGDAATPDRTHSPTVTVGGTRDGIILGTPTYMSPEQARGQVVDERTDIWAFGCVVYELLTGRAVFSGATISDTIAAILEREPEWRILPTATPGAIRRLLQHCLRKDPKQRLRHIGDARIEIEDALASPKTALDGTIQSAAAPKYGRGRQWIAAAAAVVIAAVLGAWAISRLRQPDTGGTAIRFHMNPPEGGRFRVLGGVSGGLSLALSPDGRTAVYGAVVDGKSALWLQSVDDTTARMLRGTEDGRQPFWSPDARSIAFFAGGRLKRIDVAGGAAFTISSVPIVVGGAWAPDGRILVGTFGGPLASVPASGGTLLPLTTLDTSTADVAHLWPQVLPGGNFLYFAASSKPESGVIYAASFEKPNARVRLVTSDTNALYASGRDGRGYLVWHRGRTLVAQEFDGATLTFAGEPRALADAVGTVVGARFMAAAASTSGALLYAAADSQQLTWFDRAGKQLGTLGDPGQYTFIRFSPDGHQIAAVRIEAGSAVWLIDVDRGTSRLTTLVDSGGNYPLWSPDGRTILLMGDNGTALIRKDAIGATPDQRLAPWSGKDYFLTDWSRDGRFVLNTRSTVETQADIWVVPVTPDGHLAADAQPRPYLRTPVNESAGRFSPELDPRWIAYQSDENGRNEIYVQSFPEPHGPHRISAQGGTAPQWGPGGRELFYQSLDGRVMAVSLKLGADSVEASEPHELFALPPQSIFEVAADGQRFLVRTPDPTPRPLTVIVNWPALLKQTASR